jgi:hypothetical protein
VEDVQMSINPVAEVADTSATSAIHVVVEE